MDRPSSPSTRAAASRALSLPALRSAFVLALMARAFLGLVPVAALVAFVRVGAFFCADMIVLLMWRSAAAPRRHCPSGAAQLPAGPTDIQGIAQEFWFFQIGHVA